MAMDRLNKGEWSEVYAFIKIASEGKLNIGDSILQTKIDESYKVFKIIKSEDNRVLEIGDDNVIIKTKDERDQITEVHKQKFNQLSEYLFRTISLSKERTFEVKDIKEFLNEIGIKQLKSSCNEKSDIVLDVNKTTDILRKILAFSIKSQIGNPATVLNASQKTNFIYDIVNVQLSENEINELNKKNVKGIIEGIIEKGGKLVYSGINDEIFERNLRSIDSLLPSILAQLLVYTYKSSTKGIREVFESVKLDIPDGYNDKDFYIYALKRLKHMLYLSATTMITNESFYDGEEINGGIIIVKANGELICYDLYNINDFKEYLYKNMKFESPSRSRHRYAEIYKENDKLRFKLNLQIRYK